MKDFWAQTNWYAVQSKPFHESLAGARVAELQAEIFLPRALLEQNVCGIARRVAKPLFPCYFFARFSPVILLDQIRYARGVVRVLGICGSETAMPVADEIIESIKERVQPDGFVRLEKRAFHAGDSVTIEHGCFAGWMGKVERELDDGKRVSILLAMLQQARVVVDRTAVALTGGVA